MIIYVYNKLCSKGTEKKIKYIICKLKEIYHEFIVVDFIALKDLNYNYIDTLIISGGDGSINRIINETQGYSITYAFIPLGTANDFTHNLKITSINKGIKVLKENKIKEYTVCKVNDKIFLYGLSIGSINKIPIEVKKKTKRCFKKLAYIISGLKNLKLQKERLKKDEKEISAIGMIILKTKYLGGLRIFNTFKEYNIVIIKNIRELIKMFIMPKTYDKLSESDEIYLNCNCNSNSDSNSNCNSDSDSNSNSNSDCNSKILCLDGEKYELENNNKLYFSFSKIKIYQKK